MKWSGVVALDQIGGSLSNLISYWYYLRFGVGPAEIGLITGLGRILATLSFALGLRLAKRFGTIRATVMSRVPVFAINLLTPFIPSFAFVAASARRATLWGSQGARARSEPRPTVSSRL